MYILHISYIIYQHRLYVNSINSNYNIELIPTKYRIAIIIFCFYSLGLKDSKA